MPTYVFHNKDTDEVFEKLMSFSAREQYLAENPSLEVIIGTPSIGDLTFNKKPDAGFREVLQKIKEKNDKRFTKSTVNTF
jgi:hypothetical protein